jgi:hypothetical protein
MEVNTLDEGKIHDIVREEVLMEDMDYAKLKNKVIKPTTRLRAKQDLNCHQMRGSGHNLAL